jgi:hypothetical protein
MNDYEIFLKNKRVSLRETGLKTIPKLNKQLFPHQAAVVSWALCLGKSAAFLRTGLGKSFIELEWARIVAKAEGPVLILAPLAVAQQLVGEAEHFGIGKVSYSQGGTPQQAITIGNYERLASFDPSEFAGIALDESSILKSFDGKTRAALTEAFIQTPFKLASSATPAPNDYMELGNHAEFLGVVTAVEMLAMFFVHDGGETQKWRLKGHGRKAFWAWVCEWAVNITRPSDIGFDDAAFILPPITYENHVVQVDEAPAEGMLFALPAATLSERVGARRDSVLPRVARVLDIVRREPKEKWIAWCNLNAEQDTLAKALGSMCVSISGADSNEQKLKKLATWLHSDIPVLISKSSVFGFGMNFQLCARIVFVGITDSWESYYQAVRRCWRFGQKREVKVHIVTASSEGNVLVNLNRKEKEAEQMNEEMRENMQDITRMNLAGTERHEAAYKPQSASGEGWQLELCDCIDLARDMNADSAHYSIYSPPFASLYTYSNSERDLGNSRTHTEFWEHYRFLIKESLRVMMPGRLVSIHCMNLPTSKFRDGMIGLRDFRGEIIREFEAAGFIYHSEVCIWKDPVTAMQRTKAIGLLHKQLKKDATLSRQGIADYLVTMRKPGENPEPISNTAEEFPVSLWQNYASPVWMDINPFDTLQHRSAREFDDERHIAPLQLEVIRRAVKLWSNPGELVWSPFAGIGSEGYVTLQMGRHFIGSELKRSYFDQACANLAAVATASLLEQD